MSFLRTSSPAVDFGPRRNSDTALPDLTDRTPHINIPSKSREKAGSGKTGSRRKQRAQCSTQLSEFEFDVDPVPTYASKHRTDYESVLGSTSLTADDPAPAPAPPRQDDLVCREHGCNGRIFTTSSNLARHKREHSANRPTYYCPKCGAFFSRKTARNTHLENGSCTRIRRYSNGRKRANAHSL
ncbi:hypothetical protein PVAG01_00006 [Phlyctema vagabunda]|uniref:C2H2-type domain-containing protein n=1 Tax=Phlyctema vagabunda TaxID=108571 RepID=A0ABR4PT12_9HELO